MNIVVIGGGYVGLVTAVCFAKKRHQVTLVERDAAKLTRLQAGIVPFYEPQLEALMHAAMKEHDMVPVAQLNQSVLDAADIVFICVGTPSLPDGSVDLTAMYGVADEIGNLLRTATLIVTKSTVPVGTTQAIYNRISRRCMQQGHSGVFDIATNPEFLRQGSAVNDFLYPERVIIGAQSASAAKRLTDLYKPYCRHADQIHVMRISSAELTKYVANSMLALRISFMNEVAWLADKVGADVHEVEKGVGSDMRIGSSFLRAGVGYGGSCFPKDVQGLYRTADQHCSPMQLAQATHDINLQAGERFHALVIDQYKHANKQVCVGVWGLSFKPHTDDTRYAPALQGIASFLAHGMKVVAYDPVAMPQVEKLFAGTELSFAISAEAVLAQSDCLVLYTEWPSFMRVDATLFAQLRDRRVFDGRGCLDAQALMHTGVSYVSPGRRCLQQAGLCANDRVTVDYTGGRFVDDLQREKKL